jgi:hypothetical protein
VAKSNSKPQISKPVAIVVVFALVALVVLAVVGIVRAFGPGYSAYEGQCLRSNVSEGDRDYDEMFIECSDSEAAWQVTNVYTTEPSTDAWNTKTDARLWLERKCDVGTENGPERRAFVFRLKDDHGFLACATAVD